MNKHSAPLERHFTIARQTILFGPCELDRDLLGPCQNRYRDFSYTTAVGFPPRGSSSLVQLACFLTNYHLLKYPFHTIYCTTLAINVWMHVL
jgi:hypothetical protein